jgi:tetratricopeptide (TPR) repeat protein
LKIATLEIAHQHLEAGELALAEQSYQHLLKANIKNIGAMWGLGEVAIAKHSYKRAYDLFVRCLHINAQAVEAYFSLAKTCSALQDFDKTEQALLAIYKINPKLERGLLELAIYYCESGDYAQSNKYLAEIFKLNANHVQAFSLMARLGDLVIGDKNQALIDKFQGLLNLGELSEKDQILLSYSFGDLHHQAKQYNKAYHHYQHANSLQYAKLGFTVKDLAPALDQLPKVFTASFFENYSSKIAEDNGLDQDKTGITPIFIVGQPRSGSTLLEQMLLGHEGIGSVGESPYIGSDIIHGVKQLTGTAFPEGCQLLTDEHSKALANYYLTSIKAIVPDKPYVIDKMPSNYQFIGLIKQILPHAKVIHIRRDAKDVSWSIFKNNFEAQEPQFCAQVEIGQYHQLYNAVMGHWKSTISEFICDIDYETLVDSPEIELKRLLLFCQLPYQEKCLEFSAEQRVIRTLSDIQLRAGIQKRKSPDWLPYENELTVMFSLLES